MKNMFVRLFIGFWLTMILGGAMSVVIFSSLRPERSEDSRIFPKPGGMQNLERRIAVYSKAAVDLYDYGGVDKYYQFIHRLHETTGIKLEIFDSNNRRLGTDSSGKSTDIGLTGRKVPADPGDGGRGEGSFDIILETLSDSGEAYRAAGTYDLRRPPQEGAFRPDVHGPKMMVPPPAEMAGPPPFFRGEIIRTIAMLIVASGVCYLLARSLTKPIRKLQHLAQRIAGGDYSARVADSLKYADREIIDLGRDFDVMVDRTEKAMAAQKRLLRDISHELRSPLSRLNIALELARKKFDARDDQTLAKIGKESDRLNELIGELLVLTRMESGTVKDERRSFSFTEMIAEVVRDVNFENIETNRKAAIISSENMSVTGSIKLLQRAVENIVRNAAHYTKEHTTVEIRIARVGGSARLTVRDHGSGVPEAELESIFTPFYRVAEARDRKSGGTGIGLAIAEQAVRSHGGKIYAENAASLSGLVITVELPAEPS